MLVKIRKGVLFAKLIGAYFSLIYDHLRRTYAVRNSTKPTQGLKGSEEGSAEPRTVVIIGASFSGYHAARLIASSLPLDGSWRIVIIEPNHHYQFTWTLPRFCVVEGHEDKTFVPYGPYLPPAAKEFVRWVHERVESITDRDVKIEGTGENISYDYLVVATGAGVGLTLPSRVGAVGKAKGVELLQGIQRRIKESKKLVVVGGGAAGVELATDAKQHYPEKSVTLVHSRGAVMHRFGPELQAAALKGLEALGVQVLLGERTVTEDEDAGILTLRSGKTLEFDFCVNCTGQKPSSELLRGIAPDALLESGHIRVKPTLQVDSPSLSNVYACGDVAQTGVRNPNARSAMKQAQYVADNITLAIKGQEPTYKYTPQWADSVIKLTLGLDKSITHLSDGKTELLFHGKEKDETLMIRQVWLHMGATPYEDVDQAGKPVDSASIADTTREAVNQVP
ncbi:oxidoreductase [Plectosphaerella plurivora]|uniref:Oxidoreductase n=1 Tax=Plectosphaerella plurivora TaxID=936078 RepID=A0A9P9A6H6_9PEZI|nr:oxidoreductase [Plectosphaerella plurivora]